MTANYELGLGIQTDAMANTVATYLNTLSNQLEATVGAAAQNLLSDFTFYMSLISKCIGIPIMS